MLSAKASPYMAQIMIREQMQPSPAFNILYDEIMQPMHYTVTSLIARIINVPADSEEAILCTHTILGQLLIFKTHKELLLRRTGWKTYGKEEAEMIVSLILQNTDAILKAHQKKA